MLRATPGWRRIRPAAEDFACCLCELVDLDFAEAEQVRVVMDNQSRRAACCGGWSSITRPSTPADLESEIAAWLKRRDATGAPINWMVTSEKAREKVRGPTQIGEFPSTVAGPLERGRPRPGGVARTAATTTGAFPGAARRGPMQAMPSWSAEGFRHSRPFRKCPPGVPLAVDPLAMGLAGEF